MMNKKLLAMAGGMSLFAALAFNAEAASVRITCEQRGPIDRRSRSMAVRLPRGYIPPK